MNELKFEVKQQAGVIDVNFENLSVQLAEKMKEYEGYVFTDETTGIAKAEVAKLRKLHKAIEARRIEIKKACMQPYTDFEVKVKDLLTLVEKPISLIDKQLKDFEEKRIAEKKKKIDVIYTRSIGDMTDYLPLAKIYDSKWENAGTSDKKIRETIEAAVESTRKAVETIKLMNSDATDKALDMYKKNLSLPDAITYINNYESQRAEIVRREAEKKAQEEQARQDREIERARESGRQQEQRERRIKVEIKKEIEAEVINSFIPAVNGNEKESTYKYCIKLGGEAKEKLEMYMDSVGIEWEEI